MKDFSAIYCNFTAALLLVTKSDRCAIRSIRRVASRRNRAATASLAELLSATPHR
jgi:hypothetical protein